MFSMLSRSRAALVALALTTACGRGSTVSPADGEVAAPASSTMLASPEPRPEPDDDAPEPSDGDMPPPWWTPLPAISRESLTQVDQDAVARCAERHRIQADDVTADELLAAATCFADHRAFGHEIRIYLHLLRLHPHAKQEPEVLVAMGQRYEQIDVRPKAVDAYVQYLAKYPKREDAQALGKRAVCLARTLDDTATVEQLLTVLERNYGGKGFVMPPSAAFDQLCAGLAPVQPRGEP